MSLPLHKAGFRGVEGAAPYGVYSPLQTREHCRIANYSLFTIHYSSFINCEQKDSYYTDGQGSTPCLPCPKGKTPSYNEGDVPKGQRETGSVRGGSRQAEVGIFRII